MTTASGADPGSLFHPGGVGTRIWTPGHPDQETRSYTDEWSLEDHEDGHRTSETGGDHRFARNQGARGISELAGGPF